MYECTNCEKCRHYRYSRDSGKVGCYHPIKIGLPSEQDSIYCPKSYPKVYQFLVFLSFFISKMPLGIDHDPDEVETKIFENFNNFLALHAPFR